MQPLVIFHKYTIAVIEYSTKVLNIYVNVNIIQNLFLIIKNAVIDQIYKYKNKNIIVPKNNNSDLLVKSKCFKKLSFLSMTNLK